MKREDFKEWLQLQYPDTPVTVKNRLANCANVERAYGNLDDHFLKDRCSLIISELNYTTEDERNDMPQRHKVIINGNIRNGSATLKQAVNLYVDFKDYVNSEKFNECNKHSEEEVLVNNEFLDKIMNLVSEIKFKRKHQDVKTLQDEVCELLAEQCADYDWMIEYEPSEATKDRIDIYGRPKTNSDYSVVIELDTHRADQVAKKFLSRLALLIDKKIIYLSLCYPGTKKMSIKECEKYFKYCSIVSNEFTKHSGIEKVYGGVILKAN